MNTAAAAVNTSGIPTLILVPLIMAIAIVSVVVITRLYNRNHP